MKFFPGNASGGEQLQLVTGIAQLCIFLHIINYYIGIYYCMYYTTTNLHRSLVLDQTGCDSHCHEKIFQKVEGEEVEWLAQWEFKIYCAVRCSSLCKVSAPGVTWRMNVFIFGIFFFSVWRSLQSFTVTYASTLLKRSIISDFWVLRAYDRVLFVRLLLYSDTPELCKYYTCRLSREKTPL